MSTDPCQREALPRSDVPVIRVEAATGIILQGCEKSSLLFGPLPARLQDLPFLTRRPSDCTLLEDLLAACADRRLTSFDLAVPHGASDASPSSRSSVTYLHATVFPLLAADDVIIAFRDVTQLTLQARHDARFTLLLNDKTATEAGQKMLDKGIPLVVYFLDIDNFKLYNDRHGYQAGDWTIEQVAQALHKRFREDDIIARYGGDEIYVATPDDPEHPDPEDRAEGLGRSIGAVVRDNAEKLPNGTQVTLAVSVGKARSANFPPGTRFTDLVRSASEDMQAEKRDKKDRAKARSDRAARQRTPEEEAQWLESFERQRHRDRLTAGETGQDGAYAA